MLKDGQEVSLGDGHVLEATAEGTMPLEMLLLDGSKQKCCLLIPKLAYNLLSVSKSSEAGKTFEFSESGCEIFNASGKCIAFATKVGSLYYLRFCRVQRQLNGSPSPTRRGCGIGAMVILMSRVCNCSRWAG